MLRVLQHRITNLTKRIPSNERPTLPSESSTRQPPSSTHHIPTTCLLKMHSGDQELCAPQNSQDIGQATSTNISPQPASITATSDVAPINMLLDEVLLEIFACYVEEYPVVGAGHMLACVCRRWRSIAFGSPRRLNLRIYCTKRIP